MGAKLLQKKKVLVIGKENGVSGVRGRLKTLTAPLALLYGPMSYFLKTKGEKNISFQKVQLAQFIQSEMKEENKEEKQLIKVSCLKAVL